MEEEQKVLDANLQYERQLLDHAGNLPLDVVRRILTSQVIASLKAKSSDLKHWSSWYVQCPCCNTPRIANLIRCRLLSRPRKSPTLRKIMKKERNHPERLTVRERNRLLAFQRHANTGELTCLVCHDKMRVPFPVPQKEVAEDTLSTGDKKKKKKKKSMKEVNAGLLLPSKTSGLDSEDGGRTSHTLGPTCIDVPDQGAPSQTKHKSGKKKFEKTPKEGQTVNRQTDSEKLHLNRTGKILHTSRHAVSAGLCSNRLQAPQNLATPPRDNFKASKNRQKKLLGLGNVMTKQAAKKNSEKDQNATLEDFLSSLF